MEIKGEIKYTRNRQIGAGQGMNSEVYVVDEPQLGGVLVVKEMPKSRFGGDASKFFSEAQAMFASNSPNVVPIQYASQTPIGQTPELVCLCMPYFKRGSLADRIATAPLSPREVIRVGHGILIGLGAIHAKGFIHFDIKPTNILFSDKDAPMVADFGQTCAFNGAGTAVPAGVYPYAVPPELYANFTGTIHSDIYHVGLTLYRAVNGDPFYQKQVPADAAVLQQLTLKGKFPNRDLFMPHVPKALRTTIRKALRVKPAERYGSASEMAEALGRIDIRNNWEVTVGPAAEITWRARREEKPDLIVSQKQVGSGWSVQLFTQQKPAKPRAKDTSKWKSGQNRMDSDQYLKTLFEELESA